MISTLAIRNLSSEIPDFIRQAAENIGELGREPDRILGAGVTRDADENPSHFINLEDDGKALGGVSIDPLPASRLAFDTALRAMGQNQYKVGFLPYAIIDGWQQLRLDFGYWRVAVAGAKFAPPNLRVWFAADKRRREMLILRDIGFWSHFVADGSQPLHVSIHFNGWGSYPNPNSYTVSNIHAFFEGNFVRLHVMQSDVAGRVKPLSLCACPVEERTTKYLLATHAHVIPLYQLEKANAFQGANPSGKSFVVERIADGISELRDMIVEAWQASAEASVGFPPVNVRDAEEGRSVNWNSLAGLD